MLYRAISIVIGYLFGIILSGFLYGKAKKVDIRKSGSGNVGSTNTLRTLGIKAGALTLLFDCMKAVAASLVIWLLFHETAGSHIRLLELYGCMGAVIGHDFPFYMHFKGGKGIATTLGLLIVAFPQMLPVCTIIFFIAVGTTQYVSLGSICAALSVIVQVFVLGNCGWLFFHGQDLTEAKVIVIIIGGLAVVLHHANINRLIHHKENRFSFHSGTRA